jgi:nucleoside-diphosphate-sugar epimerase
MDRGGSLTVCVTGGTGFVGGALVRRLLKDNVRVRVLARPSPRADELEGRGAEVICGSLADLEAVKSTVVGTECVYHVAAMVEAPGDTADFVDANLGGTERVFAACLAAGVRRVVYTSSIAVYGPVREGEIITEQTPYDLAPARRDSYAQSKILADRFAAEFSRQHGLPLVILRPGIVFGPGKALPIGLLGFRVGKTSVVFGKGSNRFPLNYVENLVDALLLAGGSLQAGFKHYNVLDDDDLTLEKYHAARGGVDGSRARFLPGWPVAAAGAIAEPVMRLLDVGAGAGFTSYQLRRSLDNRLYDTSRIRRELGWAPRIPLGEALRRSLA